MNKLKRLTVVFAAALLYSLSLTGCVKTASTESVESSAVEETPAAASSEEESNDESDTEASEESSTLLMLFKPDDWGEPSVIYTLADGSEQTAQMELIDEDSGVYLYVIENVLTADIVFTDGSSSFPESGTYTADEIAFCKDGVFCDSESDADGDGLLDYMEMTLGTDLNSADSDGDGLSDFDEAYVLSTDPALADSDGNGVLDGDEDYDDDGLTNAKEIELGTDPTDDDSDGDGLADGDEVNTYSTDPLSKDTDGDGLSDYNEVNMGTDPTSYDNSFTASAVLELDNITVTVELENASGAQAESLTVESLWRYVLLNEDVPGFVDYAFECETNGDIDSATVTVEFDSALLEDEDFVPCIYSFSFDTQLFTELENQTVEGNTITAQVDELTAFMFLNKTEQDAVWENALYLSEIE